MQKSLSGGASGRRPAAWPEWAISSVLELARALPLALLSIAGPVDGSEVSPADGSV
jgi:hypothetical protein